MLAATLVDDFILPAAAGGDAVVNAVMDSQANVYVAGRANTNPDYVGGIVDFDPTHEYLDNHDLIDVPAWSGFVAKYDAGGALQWVFIPAGFSVATVTVSTPSDNVYVGLRDGVSEQIARLDANSGSLLWTSMVEAAGRFEVDEQVGVTRLYAISSQTISGANYAKINAYSVGPTGLTLVWGKGMQPSTGGSAGWGTGASDLVVSADHASIYISGEFKGNADFDPSGKAFRLSTGSSSQFPYYSAGYVWKLTSAGNFVWADAFTIGKYYSSSSAGNIELDLAGNVIVAGSAYGQVDLDPGKGTLKPALSGTTDIYVAKLNPTGGLVYAKYFGTTHTESIRNMTLDANADIYITGKFTNSADPESKLNSFVQKISNNGAAAWISYYGGNVGNAFVLVDTNNRVKVMGDSYEDLYVADPLTPKYVFTEQTIYWLTFEQS